MKELEIAIEAAKAAGRLMQRRSHEGFQVFKKSEIDLVTEVDQECQKLICQMIQSEFPNDRIIAEEGDAAKISNSERRWFVDPIDGTTNYAHSYPCYCTSIAFEKEANLICGAIYDPTRDELFTASQGGGAFLNEQKLQCKTQSTLKNALLVTGFPYDLSNPATNNLREFNELMMKARAIRRDGSAALNLAYVAAGRFDGFWEQHLKVWDCAAGILMVQEAGGVILPLDNQRHASTPVNFVAANKELAQSLFDELKSISDVQKS